MVMLHIYSYDVFMFFLETDRGEGELFVLQWVHVADDA